MVKMEKIIIKKSIDDKIFLIHGHYVDDTVTIKREHLKLVHDALNNFDKNLNFTVDTFDGDVPHFLDIEFIQMVEVFLTKTQIQDNTLIIITRDCQYLCL